MNSLASSNLPRISTGVVIVELRKDRKGAEPKPKMVYRGVLLHDLRLSAIRTSQQCAEKIAMAIYGHKTGAVFDRYNIVSENDLAKASRQLEACFEHFGDKTGTECTEMQPPGSVFN